MASMRRTIFPCWRRSIAPVAGGGSHPIVRLPVGDAVMIKQILDAGVQTPVDPMVDNVEQARQLVRAVRYPPHGVRGVGAALGRATNFSRIGDYLEKANDEICLLLQIESRAGLEGSTPSLRWTASTVCSSVRRIFAADMGTSGNPGHPEVRKP